MYATTPTNVNINLNEILKAFLSVTILVKYNKTKVRPITILFKQELTTEQDERINPNKMLAISNIIPNIKTKRFIFYRLLIGGGTVGLTKEERVGTSINLVQLDIPIVQTSVSELTTPC